MKPTHLAGALLAHLTHEQQETLLGGGTVIPTYAEMAASWPEELADGVVRALRTGAGSEVAEARATRARNHPEGRLGELDMWVRDRRIGAARALLRNLNLGSENLTRLVERWGPQLWAKKGAREDFVWAVLRWGVWQEEWED